MAINPIKILKDVIDSVALTVTIDSVSSLGGGSYKVFTKETYYLRTLKKVTISSVDYQITGFSINEFITVKALSGDVPVTASSFTIDQPLFVWGNPQMVSAELVKRVQNKTAIWPYIWVVEISNADFNLDPSSEVKSTPTFNMFFLDSSDKQNWTISEHYDNAIYTLNNYLDTFVQILKSRRDLFDTDSINFNKVNHVNFGDYIVDEGMKELILNDEVTGIQVKIDVPLTIGTCKDTVITPNCTAGTVTINGTSLTFGSVPSGGTLDIDVKNTLGSQVGSEVGGEWVVPIGGSAFLLALTGQETAYLEQDDGQNFIDDLYDNEILTDFYTLKTANEWGHLKRYAGDTGGYMDEVSGSFFDSSGTATTKAGAFPNDIMRDYAFRRRWFLNRSGADTWTNRMNSVGGETKGTETGWRVPTLQEYRSINSYNDSVTDYIDSRLFNWSLFFMWTSTTDKNDTLRAVRYTAGADAATFVLKTAIGGATAYIKNF